MRDRLKVVGRGILVAVLALEAVYLVAASVFLNTSLASSALNRRPERFEIHWRFAWSLWPGMAVLHDVRTRGQSRRIDWYAHLDGVTTRFHLKPLFRRTVHITTTRAFGVDYRQRRRLEPGETSRVPPTELPTIPAFPGAPAHRPSPPRPAKPRGQPWTILADRITCDVEQLWIHRFRLTGPMRVETPMRLQVRGPLEFSRVRVTMASGDLRAGEESIFSGLGLDVEATIHPFVGRNSRGLAFFRHLSGRFGLRSDRASLFFLEAYFRKAPWLRFNDWAAVQADLRLDHGRLRPGTTLAVSKDRIDMEILDRHLTGRGEITGTVEETDGGPRSRISAHLKEFSLSPIGSSEPFARGRGATLVADSTTMDLSDPFTDLKVVFDLPEAEILDLAFYNSMIPPGSPFRLLSGTGRLRYHLEGSHEESSLHGTIDLSVKDGAARYQDYVMRGGFTLATRLRQASPRELLFDISGTRLDLHATNPGWSAAVTFPKARMRFTEPMQTDAAIRLQMQDTRPLVAMFDALKGVPDWLERMMIIENIRGKTRLDVSRERVVLKDIEITGQGLKALADLTLGRGTREGILYVRFHGLSLGIAVQGGQRDLKLLRPLHWFESERARRRPSRF